MKSVLTIALVFFASLCHSQGRLLIAAASDLKFAMDSVVLAFRATHPGKVDITYGSSGKLTEQILNGAPFDILLSADISYPEKLKAAGHVSGDIHTYARGRIVLWTSRADAGEKKMSLLRDPSVVKVAIANPRHAPYGSRAVESLEHYGLARHVRPKLVYGENVSQAAQFATAGAADAAIIALSLALSPNMKKTNGTYYLIPEESHSPLIQAAVITRHGGDNALVRSFFDFLRDATAVAILRHFGFTTP